MTDPLAEVVTLLQPQAPHAKVVGGAGPWRVRRSEPGQSFYCLVLEGEARITDDDDGGAIARLQAGDFVLTPSMSGFTLSSPEPPPPEAGDTSPVALLHGEFRLGRPNGAVDVRLLVGHCEFGSPDAALLVTLLPRMVHVRGERRLATLTQLVSDETRAQRPARDVVLARLLEVLLIEALRADSGPAASPGLLRGLADARLAAALRGMHARPTHGWTVAELAREAALSRSAFFARFQRAVGVAPMEYLLAWRMAIAKNLLWRREGGVAEVAQRVGYSSASTFSVAFTRFVGLPPARYARREGAML